MDYWSWLYATFTSTTAEVFYTLILAVAIVISFVACLHFKNSQQANYMTIEVKITLILFIVFCVIEFFLLSHIQYIASMA